MNKDLRVTLVQTKLFWENPKKNYRQIEKLLRSAALPTDLVILPEMFNTGFNMQAEKLAETVEGPTLTWMQTMAGRLNAALLGSWIVKDRAEYFNRLYVVKPDGAFSFYDKHHLFRISGEDKIFTSGKMPLTVDIQGWRIRPLICYDLRFPLWSRNKNNDYHVLIYIANWPAPRLKHWKILLPARAVENQAYVIGVNRIGSDEKGNDYPGSSLVFDPLGNVLLDLRTRQKAETRSLSHLALERYRTKFPAWRDGDFFDLKQAQNTSSRKGQ